MKNRSNITYALVIALFIFITPVLSHARIASPPPELTLILNNFAEFETEFKSGNWDKALKATDRMDATFNKMLPQLKKELKGDVGITYNEISNSIKISVRKRNINETQRQFIRLHKYIFTLIGNYEYRTPPVFIVINKYIAEANEALNEKRYNRVISELDEIISLFDIFQNYISNRDTKKRVIAETKAKLHEIRGAALNKNDETVRSEFKSLKKLLSSLI